MEKMMFALSLGFAGLILATHAAHSAPQCASRDQVLPVLQQKYGEARLGMGLVGTAQMMEIFTNPETGTWTITASLPDGLMCLVASGEHFEVIVEPLPAKGDPA
jgi:hypothetical protein